jgi:hypothetical protein
MSANKGPRRISPPPSVDQLSQEHRPDERRPKNHQEHANETDEIAAHTGQPSNTANNRATTKVSTAGQRRQSDANLIFRVL